MVSARKVRAYDKPVWDEHVSDAKEGLQLALHGLFGNKFIHLARVVDEPSFAVIFICRAHRANTFWHSVLWYIHRDDRAVIYVLFNRLPCSDLVLRQRHGVPMSEEFWRDAALLKWDGMTVLDQLHDLIIPRLVGLP